MNSSSVDANVLHIELYLYIDIDLNDNQMDLVKKCINLNLKTYYKNYQIIKIILCNDLIEKTSTEDVIKNGLLTFHNMFKKLKLKSKEIAWFLYLSNGNIQDIYKDICVLLLNTQPNKKECFYSINKEPFLLKNNELDLPKEQKLLQFKNLNDSLKNLFSQTNDETAKKISY